METKYFSRDTNVVNFIFFHTPVISCESLRCTENGMLIKRQDVELVPLCPGHYTHNFPHA